MQKSNTTSTCKRRKASKKRTVSIKDDKKRVACWILSFVPLILSSVLFVVCFICESAIWLYAICTAVFTTFVLSYIGATKIVQQKDGYTLIHAMHFFLLCKKEGINTEMSKEERFAIIKKMASKYEHAKNLNQVQLQGMYNIGKELVLYYKVEGLAKYV